MPGSTHRHRPDQPSHLPRRSEAEPHWCGVSVLICHTFEGDASTADLGRDRFGDRGPHERPARPGGAFGAVTEWSCVECGGTGDLLVSEDGRTVCLTCADLDHLVFLPAGDAAMTLRAKKASTLSAVVLRFNRPRKRYDRLGLLVEPGGAGQCRAAVPGRRGRTVAPPRAGPGAPGRPGRGVGGPDGRGILRLFPGCPVRRAEAIAEHTGLRGSGRVGRSAAGRLVDRDAMTRAVIASIRHEDTEC
jgi:hypothetical protein